MCEPLRQYLEGQSLTGMPTIRPILGRGNDQRVRILAALAPGRQPQLAGGLGGNQAACHQLGEEPLQVQAGREGLGLWRLHESGRFGSC